MPIQAPWLSDGASRVQAPRRPVMREATLLSSRGRLSDGRAVERGVSRETAPSGRDISLDYQGRQDEDLPREKSPSDTSDSHPCLVQSGRTSVWVAEWRTSAYVLLTDWPTSRQAETEGAYLAGGAIGRIGCPYEVESWVRMAARTSSHALDAVRRKEPSPSMRKMGLPTPMFHVKLAVMVTVGA